MPRTIAVAFRLFANSAVSPEKLFTLILHSPGSIVRSISSTMEHRSSTENIGSLSRLFKTETMISSNNGELLRIMSRWPFVGGSNEPGKIARLVMMDRVDCDGTRSEVGSQHLPGLRDIRNMLWQLLGIRLQCYHCLVLFFREIVLVTGNVCMGEI